MVRKSKVTRADANQSRDRHLAFLAYQLGYAGVRFPTFARYLWRTADISDPVPWWLRTEAARLVDTSDRLRSLLPSSSGQNLAEQVAQRAEQAWQGFEGAWGGTGHHDKIRRRDRDDPGWCPLEVMMEGSPFEASVWGDLCRAIESYKDGLPDVVRPWVRLGSAVASVLSPQSGGIAGFAEIAVVQNELSELLPQGLLDGLPMNLVYNSPDQVHELNECLWKRFTAGSEQHDAPHSEHEPLSTQGNDEHAAVPLLNKEAREAAAAGLALAHENKTVGEIAQETGCNRSALYRNPQFRRALEIRHGRPLREREGGLFRNREGASDVDGIVKTDPSEGIED